MSDNLDKVGKQDDIRININEPWELDDWSNKLGITKDHLKDVVKEVGPMVKDVKEKIENK